MASPVLGFDEKHSKLPNRNSFADCAPFGLISPCCRPVVVDGGREPLSFPQPCLRDRRAREDKLVLFHVHSLARQGHPRSLWHELYFQLEDPVYPHKSVRVRLPLQVRYLALL